MGARWTVEDVNRMAPDAGSVSAGRKLADARQWKLLGASDTHLWGELQGSGAKPYQTCIERAEPAFHCSCPSRKFPCKHGLALAYIEAEHPKALSASPAPAWVDEWVRKRAAREERKQTRNEDAARPPDEVTTARRAKAQERRTDARLDKVRAGMAFVSQWLQDAVRQGLATQADQPYRYWDELAARTVDAQIPGLARHFRQLPALRHAREQWHTPFLDTFARLHLLCRAFERYETLPPTWRADLEAALGMPLGKDEVLASEGVADRWHVLGTRDGEDDGLRYQRTWLLGERSARTALLLDFAARGQVLPAYAPPGASFEGEIVFYPGAWPQRALLKSRGEPQAGQTLAGGVERVLAVQDAYVNAAEKLPWIERIALTLRAVTPVLRDDGWWVLDRAGQALALDPEVDNAWELLAISGGHALDLFCEFDGDTLLPLTVADAHGVRALPRGQARRAASNAAAHEPAWRQAMSTALLGTERQQQVLSASGPVAGVLERLYPQGTVPEPAEARSLALLDALSVLALYRRGVQAPQDISSPPPACPGDELPAAGALAAGHLRHILDNKDDALLREWLATASAASLRCPPALLPSLLDRAAQLRLDALDLAAALGPRGAWLARLRDDWHVGLTPAQPDPQAEALRQWEEGSVEQRRAALVRMRQHDAGAAREKLAAVFAQDAAAVRAQLLGALEDGLTGEDEAFLETCLSDKSQEVRQRAALLLSQLPASGLQLRLVARARTWLTFKPKSGLLGRLGGRKGELEVLLPEAWDAAWAREGLAEKPPRGKGAKAWWLEQTLALTAPLTWAQHWQLGAADCLALIEGHEWRDALLGGWVQATLAQRDTEWAVALLDEAAGALPDAGLRASLWQVLAPQAREQRLIQGLNTLKGNALLALLHLVPDLDPPCSDALSQALIDAWRRVVGAVDPAADYRLYADLRDAATRLAPQALTRFEQVFARELADEGPWYKILNETRERLRFRHAMHAALCPPPEPPGGTRP